MMTKTEWLDWLESSTDRLQERYREAWTRLPRRARRAQNENLDPESKPWCAIQHEIDREPREVVVHLELPAPHTVEADVRVIGQTLAISVLRTGTGIERAPTEDCYRRAIPLPPRVDPGSAVHKVHGDELVIRMQPEGYARETARRRRAAEAAAGNDEGEAVAEAAAPADDMGDITVPESTVAAAPAASSPAKASDTGSVTAGSSDSGSVTAGSSETGSSTAGSSMPEVSSAEAGAAAASTAKAGATEATPGAEAGALEESPAAQPAAPESADQSDNAGSTGRKARAPRKAAANGTRATGNGGKTGTRARKTSANGTRAKRTKQTPSATA